MSEYRDCYTCDGYKNPLNHEQCIDCQYYEHWTPRIIEE